MGAAIALGADPRVWFAVARPHILAIVFFSTLTYGWIFTGRHELLIPLIAVWDWFIVNFTNKAVDIDEDLANGVTGAEAVQRNRRAVERFCFGMIALGLLAGVVLVPEILPFRVFFTVIGLAYNYRIFGLPRLKELYFFKNFGSSVLFTLSVFIYPLFGMGAQDSYPLARLLLAITFFIPLELTYEIFYDLRDFEGDRISKIPTYPVVHGPRRAKQIIYGLIALSALAPLAGALLGVLAFYEWCVVAACVQQVLLVKIYAGGDRLPTQREAVLVTLIGAAQLASYDLWTFLGLPLGR